MRRDAHKKYCLGGGSTFVALNQILVFWGVCVNQSRRKSDLISVKIDFYHSFTKVNYFQAKETGVGWVTARNSNHFGIAGYYTAMAEKQGTGSRMLELYWLSRRSTNAMHAPNTICTASPRKDQINFNPKYQMLSAHSEVPNTWPKWSMTSFRSRSNRNSTSTRKSNF